MAGINNDVEQLTPKQRLGCCPEGMCFDKEAIIAAERERIAKLVDDFSWTLPMFKLASLNEVSDDAAELVKEQIAAAIRNSR